MKTNLFLNTLGDGVRPQNEIAKALTQDQLGSEITYKNRESMLLNLKAGKLSSSFKIPSSTKPECRHNYFLC